MSFNSEAQSSDRELSPEYRVGGYYTLEKGSVLGKRKRFHRQPIIPATYSAPKTAICTNHLKACPLSITWYRTCCR